MAPLTAAPPASQTVALSPDAAVRPEPFGAIVYVGRRDDFFALDVAHAAVLARLRGGPRALGGDALLRARTLAALGVCRTDPPTPPRHHQRPSLVGDLPDLPLPTRPLLVNCFATAHCPLRCVYCHADDLMVPYRAGERPAELPAVVRTAAAVPAMVAVVTGGDPIVAPQRASYLLRQLSRDKRVVLDTSGAGDITPLLPVLRRTRAHVRVSVDSADPRVHDRARPVNRRYLPAGASAFAAAHATLRELAAAGVPCSVQTVVGRHNERLADLRRLRDDLVARQIRHWVLHVAVPAGKAERRPAVLPDAGVLDRLRALAAESAEAPLEIRVTGTHTSPRSVLLVDSRGRLCLQRGDGPGKEVLWPTAATAGRAELWPRLAGQLDWAGHASRYLNGPLA